MVIVDTPEAIARVHAYLDRFDRPVEQIRIQVRHVHLFDGAKALSELAAAEPQLAAECIERTYACLDMGFGEKRFDCA